MINENLIQHHDKLMQRIMNLDKAPKMHSDVVETVESVIDQLHELMPGCYVRVIIHTPEMDAQFQPDKIANGNGGVDYRTEHIYSEFNSVLIVTEQ